MLAHPDHEAACETQEEKRRAEARAAAAAIRARVRAVVDIALAAVDVTAVVFVMNGGGRFHHRHLPAEARRHLPWRCSAAVARRTWTS